MAEPTSSGLAGGLWIIKFYGWKLIAGVIAVALGFMVLWPKTAKEGVGRIAATIAGSMLFGDMAVVWVHRNVDWIPVDTVQAQMPIFVMAGLPCWWVLGIVVRSLERRKDSDIKDVINEVKQ